MNFPKVINILQSEFTKKNIDFALLGGLAIHAWGISRTTRDIDVLALLSSAPQIDQIMQQLGYEVLQRTEDVGNYLSKDWEMGRVDIVFAHRRYALEMIQRAKPILLFGSPVKILTPEDIIGLKVQASSNDPDRIHKDMSDIEALLRLHSRDVNWDLIREYFQLFKRGDEFNELQKKFKHVER